MSVDTINTFENPSELSTQERQELQKLAFNSDFLEKINPEQLLDLKQRIQAEVDAFSQREPNSIHIIHLANSICIQIDNLLGGPNTGNSHNIFRNYLFNNQNTETGPLFMKDPISNNQSSLDNILQNLNYSYKGLNGLYFGPYNKDFYKPYSNLNNFDLSGIKIEYPDSTDNNGSKDWKDLVGSLFSVGEKPNNQLSSNDTIGNNFTHGRNSRENSDQTIESPGKNPELEKLIIDFISKFNLNNFSISDVFAIVNMESGFKGGLTSPTGAVGEFQTTQIVVEDMKARPHLYDKDIINEILQRNGLSDILQMTSRSLRMDTWNSMHVGLLCIKALESKKNVISSSMLNSYSKHEKTIYNKVAGYLKNKGIDPDPNKFSAIMDDIKNDPSAGERFMKMRNYNGDKHREGPNPLQHRDYYAFSVYYMSKYGIS